MESACARKASGVPPPGAMAHAIVTVMELLLVINWMVHAIVAQGGVALLATPVLLVTTQQAYAIHSVTQY
jgi:hypothetical protein